MTLFDSASSGGSIIAIGCEDSIHRRLVDMGLLGTAYTVNVRTKHGLLVDYGEFCAVTSVELAKNITVSCKKCEVGKNEHKHSAVRQSQCR